MIDKDWLEDSIKEQAQLKFAARWENAEFDSSEARQAFQAIKNTNEWAMFKQVMIKAYEKAITNNVLNQLQGIKNLIHDAGEE
ncbi:hypothetical protein [Lactobacillus crispatus]|jgi:hypothetical protein|uniref:Uncharacterized protein n=1 Tax=Lactobacillus crispatus TaxID=47770 RepID=A0A135ZFP5_9LACO|nr:hypothetical protein [Lactobacillus crispatus]CPR80331.1 Uncharacterised protein [Chlamydia trachomatis]DAP43946.1 MAG TPA: hypothetical protein [Caudoviricetes sp.]KWU07696.1 hypothetical protein AEL97_10950 [Lactobacillus crispatus]KWX60889.1 hypothetical protein AEL94_01405 [Lactobacillus crispatus]KXI20507.1 hypothetical protein HMPREF3209_00399 [Lactobacillus crispatus]